MIVPERYRRHLTLAEWRRLALDSLPRDDRRLVESVLMAICSVSPSSEEDRRKAVECTIRYARQLGACPDLDGITDAETLHAIDLADQALDGLRGDGGAEEPDQPTDDNRAEGEWE